MDEPYVSIDVQLPMAVYEKLCTHAGQSGKDVQQLAVDMLTHLTDKEQPFAISPTGKKQIESILHHNFTDETALIILISRLVTIHVGNIEIRLAPRIWERLRSRCLGPNFDEFVSTNVQKLIRQYVGD